MKNIINKMDFKVMCIWLISLVSVLFFIIWLIMKINIIYVI